MRIQAALLALLFLAPLVANAESRGLRGLEHGGLPSIEWQKMTFEDQLQERITTAIASTIPANQFVVKVAIDLKPEIKRAPATPRRQEPPVDASITLPARMGVPLAKLDLTAALPIDREPLPVSQSEEQADSNLDLFARIQRVRTTIIVDGSQPDDKKALVERLARVMLGDFDPAILSLQVEKAPLALAEKKPESPAAAPGAQPTPGATAAAPGTPTKPAEEPWGWKRWLIELKTMVGLMGSAFILSLVGLLIWLGNRGAEAQRLTLMQARNAREESLAQLKLANAAPAAAAAAAPVDAKGGSMGMATAERGVFIPPKAGASGFDRFQKLLKDAPGSAAALVRQWLKAPGDGAIEALAVLPREIPTEELMALFKLLSPEDRREWKRAINANLDGDVVGIAEDFIARQILELLIVPPPKMDGDLSHLLSELKLSECVELATKEPELGGLLVSLLPTAQVARIFTLLSADLASQITRASMKLSEDDIRRRSPALRDVVLRIRQGARPVTTPFVERSLEVLREVGPANEESIYRALIDAGEVEALRAACKQRFPASLLSRLPSLVLKACLDQVPLAQRAEMIHSRPKEERGVFLDACGPANSRGRQVLEVEVQEVARDPARARRVERNADGYWRDFVEKSRAYLSGNETATDAAEETLNLWISELSGGQAPSRPAGARQNAA